MATTNKSHEPTQNSIITDVLKSGVLAAQSPSNTLRKLSAPEYKTCR